MSDKTGIQWTDATWNPVRGCSRVSEGCRNCYAETLAARNLPGMRSPTTGEPFARRTPSGPRWTGDVELIPSALHLPLHWRKPRRIFVNSMSDLFHEALAFEDIARVFQVMAHPECDRHTFQILTKRPERMLEFFRWAEAQPRVAPWPDGEWILRNVWLGVSVENQATADERIPLLLQTPAAVRFLSCEPLLGPVNVERWARRTSHYHVRADVEGMLRNRAFDGLVGDDAKPLTRRQAEDKLYEAHASGVKYLSAGACDAFDPQEGCPGHRDPRVDWIIAGGESGPGARPMHPEWARSLRDQCTAASVPFFFKQWGEHAPCSLTSCTWCVPIAGVHRVGKKTAGRRLDGRTWDQFPA